MFKEAEITINNHKCTIAHALVIRVAIEQFHTFVIENSFGEDALGKVIRQNYIERLNEIRTYLYDGMF